MIQQRYEILNEWVRKLQSYRHPPTPADQEKAREQGVVFVYAAEFSRIVVTNSRVLLRFRGAAHADIDAFNGDAVYMSQTGEVTGEDLPTVLKLIGSFATPAKYGTIMHSFPTPSFVGLQSDLEHCIYSVPSMTGRDSSGLGLIIDLKALQTELWVSARVDHVDIDDNIIRTETGHWPSLAALEREAQARIAGTPVRFKVSHTSPQGRGWK